jgi:hypothetical protein
LHHAVDGALQKMKRSLDSSVEQQKEHR